MNDPVVRIAVQKGAFLPEYKSAGAAGADLRAFLTEALEIPPGARFALPTGLRIELPEGFEAQIRPRSGLALEKGVTCLNTPGTVDSDYRGEIKVILANLGSNTVRILPGDRIAQMVIAPVCRAQFIPSEELGQTSRGAGGFGSTGI